ncbi:MAG: hypothetical protein EAZ81_05990 [Verrucomicrobia bacterium]|nr:MAG: hypothetical protein EAZ81_05990 [Verrucomicrobiota bacterium]
MKNVTMRGLTPKWIWGVMMWGMVAQAEELGVETSAAMVELIHRPRHAPANWASLSGAISLNIAWEKDGQGKWYVELQRDGGRWVLAGIAHRDAFHSASFLVETTAHSIRYLEASDYAKQFTPEIAALKPQLLRCALWMISPSNDRAVKNQRIYCHRRFLVGAALLQTSMIHRHDRLKAAAHDFVEDGIRLQRHDGAFPEKGGHDSSYHAVALIYLQRIILEYPTDEQDASWNAALDRGVQWLCQRIDDQGRVDVRGNTRTGSRQETGRSGKIKEVNLPEVATALLYSAYRKHDAAYEALARKVLAKASQK